MRFISTLRLLVLAIWVGAAVFFIGVAQAAFAVVPEREIAGAVVGRTLSILNYGGMAIAVLMLITSVLGVARLSRFWLWVERFLLMVVGAACATGEFVIGAYLALIRQQLGRPIDEVAADDPLRLQFGTLHEYSVWVLMAGLAAAVVAFLIVANRKFVAPQPEQKSDIYDFSNEFKS